MSDSGSDKIKVSISISKSEYWKVRKLADKLGIKFSTCLGLILNGTLKI